MPFTYRHATDEWRRFLATMRARTLIESDNVIYTALDGLFRAFRCRVPPHHVIDLGNELPCVMRSMLVWCWDMEAPRQPWLSRDALETEIRHLRQAHNFAPKGILDDLVWGVRTEVREMDFDRVLQKMSPEAQALWTVKPN